MEQDFPIFLDIEASSLSDQSYPIEIAWSDEGGDVECHLIDPADVEGWTDWSEASAAVHGITKAILGEFGESPFSVAYRIQQRLRYREIYVTAPDFDQFWMNRLLFACGAPEEAIKLLHINSLWLPQYTEVHQKKPLVVSYDETWKAIRTSWEEAWARVTIPRHRAGADVQHMVEFYRLVTEKLKTGAA